MYVVPLLHKYVYTSNYSVSSSSSSVSSSSKEFDGVKQLSKRTISISSPRTTQPFSSDFGIFAVKVNGEFRLPAINARNAPIAMVSERLLSVTSVFPSEISSGF